MARRFGTSCRSSFAALDQRSRGARHRARRRRAGVVWPGWIWSASCRLCERKTAARSRPSATCSNSFRPSKMRSAASSLDSRSLRRSSGKLHRRRVDPITACDMRLVQRRRGLQRAQVRIAIVADVGNAAAPAPHRRRRACGGNATPATTSRVDLEDRTHRVWSIMSTLTASRCSPRRRAGFAHCQEQPAGGTGDGTKAMIDASFRDRDSRRPTRCHAQHRVPDERRSGRSERHFESARATFSGR